MDLLNVSCWVISGIQGITQMVLMLLSSPWALIKWYRSRILTEANVLHPPSIYNHITFKRLHHWGTPDKTVSVYYKRVYWVSLMITRSCYYVGWYQCFAFHQVDVYCVTGTVFVHCLDLEGYALGTYLGHTYQMRVCYQKAYNQERHTLWVSDYSIDL